VGNRKLEVKSEKVEVGKWANYARDFVG